MIAVIFELLPAPGRHADYLALAADLRPILDQMPGFVSVERFQSLSDPEKLLSLSIFADEAAVARWRNATPHRGAKAQGRDAILAGYRLRVAQVPRDYGMEDRGQAPPDSRLRHG